MRGILTVFYELTNNIGLSPLMRGILQFTKKTINLLRIIPAHAGNTKDGL